MQTVPESLHMHVSQTHQNVKVTPVDGNSNNCYMAISGILQLIKGFLFENKLRVNRDKTKK